MKIAFTGAGGGFGRHFQALLEERAINAIPLSRSDWDMRIWCRDDELDHLFAGADTLVHAAAVLTPAKGLKTLFDTNLRATINIADWAQRRKLHFIFISSGSVYADCHAPQIDERSEIGPGNLGGLYATTKRLAETALQEFQARGLSLTILRPSSVYGIGLSSDALISKLISAGADGDIISLEGVNNAINFMHFHDLARAALAAATDRVEGCFNIAATHVLPIAEVVETIAETYGVSPCFQEVASVDPPFSRFDFDISAARTHLGYEPAVSFAHGIWMIKKGQLLPRQL